MNIPYLNLDIITFIKKHVYFAGKCNNLIVPDVSIIIIIGIIVLPAIILFIYNISTYT